MAFIMMREDQAMHILKLYKYSSTISPSIISSYGFFEAVAERSDWLQDSRRWT